jgi:hypothetical protein
MTQKLLLIVSLMLGQILFASTELPVNLRAGEAKSLPGPQGYTYSVSCESGQMSQPQPQPEPLKLIQCRIRYNGGPAQGVYGNTSYDKCSAVWSAIVACKRSFSDQQMANQFCVKDSLSYGSGASCKDSDGNEVSVSSCPN